MSAVQVHVRLLNAATDALRATLATEMGGGMYKLFPTDDYETQQESWEFVPGSMVRAEKRTNPAGETFLLAVKL
ncbi:MAG TPA: hypothetical protein VM009_00315 [Terriglobales bacterium]|nr:hypothetical protein [Terriglobales bacterium]